MINAMITNVIVNTLKYLSIMERAASNSRKSDALNGVTLTFSITILTVPRISQITEISVIRNVLLFTKSATDIVTIMISVLQRNGIGCVNIYTMPSITDVLPIISTARFNTKGSTRKQSRFRLYT